ncbi:uncharacterized protein L3040_004265 [Drepanopeziza brunnea f. sp. 'multigermtubi']|uniref:uncharacterized protein n=1 Tax=Drepanopeziza brunnea f. sp. 'multigermtubi' TaxID=698441 RepID=UPI002394E36B|nr:hypothetical protein L3040_004265 [Drepanopeziza brunnea f. sp. 'multigermtubi']
MTELNMQLEDWLDDLCVRFILNLPLADLESIERICFQVEEAQWFYEDFIRPLDPALPSMSLRHFCERIFSHCPLLSAFSQGEHMQAFEQFMEYKARIPVRGAILLNEEMDSAVLVKGWKKGANWSFPRGKINKDEDDMVCAIREVYEETGYDLVEAGLVPEGRDVKSIEVNMRDQQMQLFVFKDVPMDTYFAPRTRKEISKIQWWRLSDLPAFRKKGQATTQGVVNANKFYMVAPFLVPLRKWILEEKKKGTKRRLSKQYLSTGDEIFTEEDQGVDSAGPGQTDDGLHRGMPDQSSLEDASAALNRLLKIQQPQELQAEPTPVPQPVNKVGNALLALLHNKPATANEQIPKVAPPHTPMDHARAQPQMPPTPHHFPPRPPQFSSMPPPPTFPFHPQQQQPETFSHQLPNLSPQYPRHNSHQNFPPHKPTPQRTQNPHIHQSQHLVHPQPLPPHVQRAVFTGGPAHAPMVPPPRETQPPQHHPTVPVALPSPMFPGLHSTMVLPQPKQTPPKLTSHSLALLNAFKIRDQAASEAPAPRDLPLRQYASDIQTPRAQPMPQELPADASQNSQEPRRLRVGQPQNGHPGAAPPSAAARPAISDTQKSTLLGLFNSPKILAAVPAGPLSATALPPSLTPSAVELSAVEPLSTNAAVTSALLNDKRVPDQAANIGTKLALPPGSQLPFRPATILARPVELSEEERAGKDGSAPKMRSNGKKATPVSKRHVLRAEKSLFQPQILKRPQPAVSKTPDDSTLQQPSFPVLAQPSFERPASATDHTQTLLSLFRKVPVGATPLSQGPSDEKLISISSVDPMPGLASRTRVGSLASMEMGPRRGSQTPISPADTGFLLNYLDAVANGVQR